MNTIVRRHFPVEKLPPELRDGLPDGTQATVVVTVDEPPPSRRQMSLEEIRALRPRHTMTAAEIDQHIEELRAEWE